MIKNVILQNFRIHENYTVKLSPKTTIIIGPNGSGKTSIVEAIYVALRGTSFKGSDSDILGLNDSWWRIDIEMDNQIKRTVKYESQKQFSKKQFMVDSKKYYRLPARNKLPIVLFEPNNLRLLDGSPSRRRDFIDKLIEQTDINYHTTLNKYDRALKQRNSILKNRQLRNEDVFVWDVALSEYGSEIIQKRISFLKKIDSRINEVYQKLSNTNDVINVSYSRGQTESSKQKILNKLSDNLEKDKILGYTTTGPHRDDVIFNFNNSPTLTIASRGEVRTVVVALKFLEVEIIKEILNINPVILLDDVFSELDESRQKHLSELNSLSQIIITSTDYQTKTSDTKGIKKIKLLAKN